MRLLPAFCLVALLISCKKDKFTTVPQIKYKSVSPNSVRSDLPGTTQVMPVVTIEVTDSEGDLGLVNGKDTSKVYVKNLLTNKLDSLLLPELKAAATKNFKGDINITMERFLGASTRPRPKTDTLYFEIYIKDFAKNKSNVIKTGDPVYYITP
jgi:hypothetical protein